MIFSYNWLKNLIDFDKTPQQLAEDLSLKSVEVEGLERFGGDFLESIVVGEIKEIEPHPDADKLRIATVDVGDIFRVDPRKNPRESALLQIVCGAPNIEVGQKVPVALVGAKLPPRPGSGQAAVEIKEAKIRGVESFGMLCAEDELGFGSDHSGIMILDSSLPVGKKLSEIFNDWALDGTILSNRGDLQNHIGLAREIGAIYGRPLNRVDDFFINKNETSQESSELQVEIRSPEACSVYMAQVIKGVKIGPSPMWIKQRLASCGVNSINNIVDITNYVMLECGNPLHAFDKSRIDANSGEFSRIVVRLSQKGESIKTLDDKEHELPEGLLVIADSASPIAVAGVMGGANSEIDETTTDIVLESAVFTSKFIRKSQRELGLRTEASGRFEKGLSSYLAEISLNRAAQLIAELCGGELVGSKVVAGELDEKEEKIEVDIEKIREYLSQDFSDEEFWQILGLLGFGHEGDATIIIPLWRKDVSIWQDIAEEVGRIYGLDKVKERDLTTDIAPRTVKALYFDQATRKYLSSIGLTEAFTYSIVGSDLLEKTMMGGYSFFEIANPLNEYDYIMRGGLWSGLLEAVADNAKKLEKITFFDLSKVYLPGTDDDIPSTEEKHLSIMVYGENADEGLFVAKSYLDGFAEHFGLQFSYENEGATAPFVHPGRNASVHFNGEKIGRICEIHPVVLENLGIKNRVWAVEINFDALVQDAQNVEEKITEIPSDTIFQEFSRFEVSKRDIAVIVGENVDSSDLADEIRGMAEEIIAVELFDEFKSDKLGEGKKSLAYHIVMQSSERTLTDLDINQIMELINVRLVQDYDAQIR